MRKPKDILPPWYLARKLDPDKLPPWTGNQKAQREMYVWVNLELDLILDAHSKERQNKAALYWTKEKYAEALPRLREATAIKYAEHGNVEPLRRLSPRHARFINLPTLGRGQRWPELPDIMDRLPMAADDVRRIRAIWKLHFKYKNRRRPGPEYEGDMSAEEIAAERWDLGTDGVEKIMNFMK